MKTQINLRLILFSLLMTFLFFTTTPAQCQPEMVCIAETEVATETAKIAVQIPVGSPITKIHLIYETIDYKPVVTNVSAGKSYFLPVKLRNGVNDFNFIVYVGNQIISSTPNPIRIEKKESVADALSVSEKIKDGSRLHLRGEGEIKNQQTYKLEIDAGEMPPLVGSYAIEIKNTDKKGKNTFDSETKKIEFDAGINRHKQLQSIELKLREGSNTITVFPRVDGQNLDKSEAQIEVKCTNCKDQPASGENVIVRSIIGLEQVGASSARSEQRPFLNLFFNTPINVGTKEVCPEGKKIKGEKGCVDKVEKIEKPEFTFSVWGDIRLTTTPVQSIGSLASFTPAGFASNFVQGDSAGKVNDLVRSFDFLVGFDKQIVKPGAFFDGIFPGRTSLSFIAAGGAISPLSSDKGAVFFKVPTINNGMEIDPTFLAAFPEADGKKTIAFVAPERDRFFRQYYAGFRLKTIFKDKEFQYLPAMFDVTFGQNEAITNRLKGVILRLDGSTPFPVSKAGFLYLFGSVNMRLGRSKERLPTFFLEPATDVTLTSADTVVLPFDRAPFQTKDRDVFRIGVGVDVFKLFKKDETPK